MRRGQTRKKGKTGESAASAAKCPPKVPSNTEAVAERKAAGTNVDVGTVAVAEADIGIVDAQAAAVGDDCKQDDNGAPDLVVPTEAKYGTTSAASATDRATPALENSGTLSTADSAVSAHATNGTAVNEEEPPPPCSEKAPILELSDTTSVASAAGAPDLAAPAVEHSDTASAASDANATDHAPVSEEEPPPSRPEKVPGGIGYMPFERVEDLETQLREVEIQHPSCYFIPDEELNRLEMPPWVRLCEGRKPELPQLNRCRIFSNSSTFCYIGPEPAVESLRSALQALGYVKYAEQEVVPYFSEYFCLQVLQKYFGLTD